jgi:hypothetical protein
MTTIKNDEAGGVLWHVDEHGRFVWGSPADRERAVSEPEAVAIQQLREQAAREKGFDPDTERGEAAQQHERER